MLNVIILEVKLNKRAAIRNPSGHVSEEISRQILILNEALRGALYCGLKLMFRVTRLRRYDFNFSPFCNFVPVRAGALLIFDDIPDARIRLGSRGLDSRKGYFGITYLNNF